MKRFAIGLLLSAFVQNIALGTPVIITSNLTIDPNNAGTYQNQDVIVRGCTVTINVPLALNSLSIERNASNAAGVVTHEAALDGGLQLTIATSLSVEGADGALVASRIDVGGRGFAAEAGPGAGGMAGSRGSGGGHGGNGGDCVHVVGGAAYDSLTAPTQLGSGGGDAGNGGAGGGAIRLVVNGALTVNGQVSANGNGAATCAGGGGAGGSIYVTAGSLGGAGSISANGGVKGCYSEPGGGAGGRIAVYFGSSTFSGTWSAVGGSGWMWGGAGTILTKAGPARAEVRLDNGGNAGAVTPIASLTANLAVTGAATWSTQGAVTIDGDVAMTNAGVLTHGVGGPGVALTTTGALSIDASSRVLASGRGYAAGEGPGAGGTAGNRGSGGGHGGNGGNGAYGAVGGAAYDTLIAPTEFGSGGGEAEGGRGGGAVRVIVNGTMTLDGEVNADGSAASNCAGGGGAGGSVYVTAGSLGGAGSISASGGTKGCYSEPGGGAGGRIAVYFGSSTFTGTISGAGGVGWMSGGAGTIFTKATSDTSGDLVVQNAAAAGAWTPLLVAGVFDQVSVADGGRLDLSGAATLSANSLTIGSASSVHLQNAATVGDVLVQSGGILGHSAGQPGFDLTVPGDLTVEAGGRLQADAAGYAAGTGPGAGGWAGARGSGGGHGGNGGDCQYGAPGGAANDALTAPTDFGSGGGDADNGGRGGGVIRATVGGTLTIDGELSARGGAAASCPGGGGAGGSIHMTVGALAGAGPISVDGGSRGCFSEPGGGAGGRIAIYYGSNTYSGTMSAYGYAGWMRGGAGTIYTKAAADTVGAVAISNGGDFGAWTPLTSPEAFDLAVAAKAIVYPLEALVLRSLAIGADGYLTSTNEAVLDVTIQQAAAIAAGGHFTVDGRGYAPGSGPGAGGWTSGRGSGGGHGGNGGNCSYGVPGGVVNDALTVPIDFGSGGGDAGNGGRGGGAIHATVGGTLTVEGEISARGNGAATCAGGGGAGGSLYLNVHTLTGAGTIAANGGDKGCYGEPGGGAGGRIAIYFTSNSFAGTVTAYGGSGWMCGGAGTIFRKAAAQPHCTVWLDNNGVTGAATPMGSVAGDLTIGNGAWVYPTEIMNIAGDLVVGAAGILTHLAAGPALEVNVGGAATVAAGGAISVDSKGYPAQTGPGAGSSAVNRGSGAGYGGRGGNCSNGALGGSTYGFISEPADLGSGGGMAGGGAGGGAVHLAVDGVLTVAGQISAKGANAPTGDGGGGSGGSLWLAAGTLAGPGTISANGGNKGGYGEPGGGGGGRIAIYTCDWQMFPSQITVAGGSGWQNGSPGTILFASPFVHVTQQPTDVVAWAGDSVILSVVATTTAGDLYFQWRRNGVDVVDNDHITGASTNALHIDPVGCADGGVYDVWMTDDCGNLVSESAHLYVPPLGDMNCDGSVDFDDIDPFVLALSGQAGYEELFPSCRWLQGDCDLNGTVSFDDIGSFVALLGTHCP